MPCSPLLIIFGADLGRLENAGQESRRSIEAGHSGSSVRQLGFKERMTCQEALEVAEKEGEEVQEEANVEASKTD